MKRKLFASVMAGLLSASVLTGCGGNGTTPEENNAVSAIPELTQPVAVKMWHYMTGAQEEVLQEIVKEFNETNTMGITVTASAQGRISDLNKKVIAAAQSNTLPAIINVYPDLATGLINQGKIYDLSAFVTNPEVGMVDDLKNDFNEAFIAEVAQWDAGKIYGLPMTKSTEVVYVNKDLVEKLGYTMDDLQGLTMEKLAEISKKSKEELGLPGFGFDSSSNAFISALKMDGKDFVELNGTINVDNEWVREFMEFFKANTEAGYFRTAGEDKFLSGPFSNGQMLMYQGSSAGASHINNNDAFEIAVVEVPSFAGKDKSVIQQGGSLFITTDVSKEQQYAAYEFMKFVTSAENTAKFAVRTGYLPVRQSAENTEVFTATVNDPASLYGKVYPASRLALAYAYYTPAVSNAQSARSTIQEKYDAFVSGNIADMETFITDTVSEVGTSIQRQ
ncbi:MAG: extracellular solute-binding protein [Cellulosilyticaceae bacterium]